MRHFRCQPVTTLTLMTLILACHTVSADNTIRARNLGIPFEGQPGPLNAMAGAVTVVGASGFRVEELPEEQVRAIFQEQ